MRFTNDTVEYVSNLARKHTLEDSLEIINKEKPELEMTEAKLKEMEDRYLIKFIQEGAGIFTTAELNAIKISMKTTTMKETYNMFCRLFDKDYTYKIFVKELSKLNFMKPFDVQQDASKFTPLEEEYIKILIEENEENSHVFSEFNLVFPNRYGYYSFVPKLNSLKLSLIPNGRVETRAISKDIAELVDFLKFIQGDMTIIEYLEMVKADVRFKDLEYNKLYYVMTKYGIPFKKEVKGNNKIEPSKEDIEVMKSLASKTLTIAEFKEKVDKEIEVFRGVSVATFGKKAKEYGVLEGDLRANRKARNDIPKGTGAKVKKPQSTRGTYNKIYNDVAVTVQGNTIEKALEELKSKHPDLAPKMSIQSLRQFANRHDLKFLDGRGAVEVRVPRKRANSDLIQSIYDRAKEISNQYTKSECTKVLNGEFGTNYSVAAMCGILDKRGGIKFKVYTEFTPKMEQFVREQKEAGIGSMKIYQEFNKRFPSTFAANEFFKAVNRLDKKPEAPTKIVIHNTADTSKPQIQVVEISKTKAEEPVKREVQPLEVVGNQDDGMSPFQPIIDEVNNVFERKCHQLGITGDTYTHANELIFALETLIKYAKDKSELVRLTNDHEDVLEQYRREVEHEIELQPFSETDTYCQNKLKAIAMRRREVKYTRDDLNLMSMLLKNINENIDIYNTTLNAMKERADLRENSIFIPLVDSSMVDKYDWCKRATLNNKRAYTPILKTNARLDRINNHKASGSKNIWTETETVDIPNTDQVGKPNKNAHKVSTYRVKAEFMVLKGNPFVNKYYDIQTTNEDLAKEKGAEYFDLISANNDNAKYKITDVIKLNR